MKQPWFIIQFFDAFFVLSDDFMWFPHMGVHPTHPFLFGTAASGPDRPPKGSNKQPVRNPPKRETSQRAKDMMADADAARKVFERMQNNLVQDFSNIQWFPRPEDPQPCHNISTCGCEHAMCWCHACGDAYCLDCRSRGEACKHGPCNYSSEMSDGGNSILGNFHMSETAIKVVIHLVCQNGNNT